VSPLRVDSVAFLFVLIYPRNKTAKFEWRLQHVNPLLITAVRRFEANFKKVKQHCFLSALIDFGLMADFHET
jgi:hypothetical protein